MGYVIFLIVLIILFLSFLRQVDQYQRGVMFTMGKYSGTRNPGWRLVVPIFQRMVKVDMRIKAVDVPDQEAITKDNVSCQINAVIYYKVIDAAKAVIEVENFYYAVSQMAQTTMRNVAGEVDLDELLTNRDAVSNRIKNIVDKLTDPWGIKVDSVDLKDIVLPEEMKRTMAKQAEAERERRAVIIKAEGEVKAAENLAKAGEILSAKTGALHLRTLNSLNDISSDQSNTIVYAIPLEIIRAFENIGNKFAHDVKKGEKK
ncbi:MAG: slipin family protein [Candidatus Buchananbacteria bacterium]|nr:slipin family protein [Candidatus Buchananbacteria bacterium]